MNVTVCGCFFCIWKGVIMIKNGNWCRNTRIIVERVYVGSRKMEDVFKPINEENARRNIEEKIRLKKET